MRILLLSVVLLCAAFVAGCGRQTAKGVAVDPAFKTLIAPDTKLLSGVEWDALKASPFYQRHQNDLDIPLFDAAAERMGVNPLRDISKLVAAWNGNDWVFMERGRFNASDLQQKMIAAGAQTTTYRNHRLIGNTGGSIVFFKSIAVEGSSAALHHAIDLESAGEGEVPEELEERLRMLPKGDQLWTVSRAGLAFANLPMTNSDVGTALSNITGSISGTTAGLYVDTGVHLSIDLQCVSDTGATRVHDALRGMIGFGRLSTKDDEQDLLRAYDAIQVEKQNQVVRVRADLTGDLADKLVRALTSLRRLG